MDRHEGRIVSCFLCSDMTRKATTSQITREEGTRRINLAIPEESLLVEKAIEAVPHTGGKLFEKTASIGKHWSVRGRRSARPRGHCKARSDRVISTGRPFEGPGVSQQMTVLAHYSDGTTRDVTR